MFICLLCCGAGIFKQGNIVVGESPGNHTLACANACNKQPASCHIYKHSRQCGKAGCADEAMKDKLYRNKGKKASKGAWHRGVRENMVEAVHAACEGSKNVQEKAGSVDSGLAFSKLATGSARYADSGWVSRERKARTCSSIWAAISGKREGVMFILCQEAVGM